MSRALVVGLLLLTTACVAVTAALAGAFSQGPARAVDMVAASDVAASDVVAVPVATSTVAASSPTAVPSVDPAWVASTARSTGIPSVAVAAYGRAQLRLDAEQPGCHLGWNTLAGLGWIESGHGTHGGAVLEADGTTDRPIIGPALDGTQGLAAIRSTPRSAEWHGDTRWDHAVGPLQFIGSTWETWGSDDSGDGVADPGNIFDAAYTAGRYLCADGHDLRTGAGWTAAVHSFNHDDAYVVSVRQQADAYARDAG